MSARRNQRFSGWHKNPVHTETRLSLDPARGILISRDSFVTRTLSEVSIYGLRSSFQSFILILVEGVCTLCGACSLDIHYVHEEGYPASWFCLHEDRGSAMDIRGGVTILGEWRRVIFSSREHRSDNSIHPEDCSLTIVSSNLSRSVQQIDHKQALSENGQRLCVGSSSVS